MDNVSFNYKQSGQKWKYVLQRWTATEREISEETLNYK